VLIKHNLSAVIIAFILTNSFVVFAQEENNLCKPSSIHSVFLRSHKNYNGNYEWLTKRFEDIKEDGDVVSKQGYKTVDWLPAIVPGTVLNSLVENKIYPEPYYGDNNKKNKKLIPDMADVGREFYHYWYRTEFEIPKSFVGKRVWLKFHGINYRTEIWVNGISIGKMEGMFNTHNLLILLLLLNIILKMFWQ
jgi:hypothetical protein